MAEAAPGPLRRRLDPEGRYGLRVTLLAAALVLVAVPFGLLLDQVVRDGPVTRLDTWAARNLHERVRHAPGAVDALQVVSFTGSGRFLAVLAVAVAVRSVRRRHWRVAVFVIVTGVAGGTITTVVKAAVDRDRPSLEAPVATARGQSFPSGHAMSSTVVYGAVVLTVLPEVRRRRRRAVVAAVVVLVAAIGATRLALGVHYLSDVLGGFALGLAWLAASAAAFSVWRVERGSAPVDPMDGLEPEAGAGGGA